MARLVTIGSSASGALVLLASAFAVVAEETSPNPVSTQTPAPSSNAPALRAAAALGPAPKPWDAGRLARIVADLSDENFGVREAASRELDEAPVSQFRALVQAAARSDDPETRRRLQTVAEKIFREKILLHLAEWRIGRGFLGIQWTISGDPPGVLVAEIIPGTGAEKAGLKAGDILVRIDGKACEEGFAFEDALKIWKAMAPGDPMKLEVKRPNEAAPLEFHATIGEQPKEYTSDENDEHRSEVLWERYLAGNLKIQDHLLQPDAPRPIQSWPKELEAREEGP